MKPDKDDASTASKYMVSLESVGVTINLGGQNTVVPNNHRPILGTMSEAETVALGGMLDRLDGLEEAIRVRPNARAIAAFRESVATELEFGDPDPGLRMVAQCGAILLDMLDKIMAVKP